MWSRTPAPGRSAPPTGRPPRRGPGAAHQGGRRPGRAGTVRRPTSRTALTGRCRGLLEDEPACPGQLRVEQRLLVGVGGQHQRAQSGSRERSSRQSSTPLPSGRRTSSTATSGRGRGCGPAPRRRYRPRPRPHVVVGLEQVGHARAGPPRGRRPGTPSSSVALFPRVQRAGPAGRVAGLVGRVAGIAGPRGTHHVRRVPAPTARRSTWTSPPAARARAARLARPLRAMVRGCRGRRR